MLRRPGDLRRSSSTSSPCAASAPPERRAQLYHIAAVVNGNDKIEVRVLPIEARIEGFAVPRSAFSIYTFHDPDDPTVVAVDTVTDDLVLTDGDEVKRYDQLFGRLREAALPVADSLDLLLEVAKRL